MPTRDAFLARLGRVLTASGTVCLAWSRMPNHAHLLLQTGKAPLATVLRRLLRGYAVTCNRRHRRPGHLFQNRYQATHCQQDPYLLELVRYLHLIPAAPNCSARGGTWSGIRRRGPARCWDNGRTPGRTRAACSGASEAGDAPRGARSGRSWRQFIPGWRAARPDPPGEPPWRRRPRSPPRGRGGSTSPACHSADGSGGSAGKQCR